jgi:peptide deformylase
MICEIMKDEDFLKQASEHATQADIPVADDLLETLIAHKDGCVGMAANTW